MSMFSAPRSGRPIGATRAWASVLAGARRSLCRLVVLAAVIVAPAAQASLSGSSVEFDCDGCYVEGTTQTMCFDAHSYTDDGEMVQYLWLQFPDDWVIHDAWNDGPQQCDDPSSTWGSFGWNYHAGNPWEVQIAHERYQGFLDHCSTRYCFTVETGVATGVAQVSWYWADATGQGVPPHYPASNDGYTPSGWFPADEAMYPAADVPHCDPRVLLIQDSLPGGSSAWQDVLTTESIFFDEIYSNEIQYTNLDEYDLVITSSRQGAAYHTEINNAQSQFEDYIDAGGRLLFAASSQQGATPYPTPPFGATFSMVESSTDTVDSPDHPLMAEVSDPIGPNTYTSRGYYAGMPVAATVLTRGQNTGAASTYEVQSGQGVLLVTTMELEVAFASVWDFAEMLPNAIDYLLGYSGWDRDGDGFGNCADNCADAANPFQEDGDGDGIGDVCDSCTDADGDGFGDPISDTTGCPWGYTPDCDDTDADVYPGLPEWYDGKDNDCDGLYDDGVLPNGAVIITEIMKDPGVVGDTVGEWFEIYNNTQYDLNLVGLEVEDDGTNSFEVDVDLWIAPAAHVVMARQGDVGVNGGVTSAFVYSNFQLDNTDDEIVLIHAGVQLDRVAYDAVNWPDPTGATLSLEPGAYDVYANDSGSNWCAGMYAYGQGDLGSPNDVNPSCCSDFDGDGYFDIGCAGTDCDDTNPDVNPGAAEVCDGFDNDCDGTADNGFDLDADGWATCLGDCDDNDPAVNPGQPEVCDGVDNNCDGSPDEQDADGCTTYYRDEDTDGYGLTPDNACLCGPLWPYSAIQDGDCDDANAQVNPGFFELCDGVDNNCDGAIDEGYDNDGDGHTLCGGDCNDFDAAVNPDAPEYCNGYDDDCDGTTDESDAVDTQLWYPDNDGDGYGSPGAPVQACAPPAGYGQDATDCDDNDPGVNPGQLEICNGGVDDDCNPATNESYDGDGDGFSMCDGDCDDTDASLNLADNDADGASSCDGDCDDYNEDLNIDDLDGDGSSTCEGDCDDTDASVNGNDADGDGLTSCDGDCNDNNPDVYPGMPEECDGFDNDCDPLTDENVDDDGDGLTECDGDCDDYDASISPDAIEVCDDVDNDCDPNTDEHVDDDGDGLTDCQGDCNDDSADTYPGATEVCDGLDNDCDGSIGIDEADLDGDGFLSCDLDCDDNNPFTYTGADELCDQLDNDCDGTIDEGVLDDLDGDGWTVCNGDCDDAVATVYPGAPELCDGYDNDCSGLPGPLEKDEDGDGWMICDGDCNDADASLNLDDADADGWATCDGDCDDSEAAVNPGSSEVCDGLDNNCDGLKLYDEVDGDGDGYLLCGDDCDDEDPEVNPDADEICDDGVDNNCDGSVDEACGDDDDAADDDDSAMGDDDFGNTCDCQNDIAGIGEPVGHGALLLIGAIALAIRRRR